MNWSLQQLFPTCLAPHCPKYNTRHMLSHQEEIATQVLTGDENYIYLQGGVGSAKTILFACITAALAIMIPNSRGILFRKDYELNHETLWGYFLNAIEAAFDQSILKGSFKRCLSVKKAGKHTEVTLPNGSYYKAGETKNWSRFMGPSYDVITVSDAMENNDFGSIFHGEGTVGGLQSRLRGQRSSFFKLNDGQYKDMRRFLIESNPPPNINELHVIFGKEPGIRNLTTTSDPITQKYITYNHIQTSSIQNDHNPSSYIAEISAMHSNPQDIQRILEGKTIPYYGGVRVIETFQQEVHVSSFDIDTNLPLFIAIDPGYQHPSVTFSQIKRCGYDREHFITLSEITNLYNKTTHELTEWNKQHVLGILAHLNLFYPSYLDYMSYINTRDILIERSENNHFDYSQLEEYFKNIRFCIDRAGERKYTTNKDRETDVIILRTNYGIRCKYRTNIALDRSLDRVRESFKRLCACNIPEILIDKKCEMLIDGYAGGYRYSKNRDGTHSDKPIKDHTYDDVCDSHRYALENFFYSNPLDIPNQEVVAKQEEEYYSWMLRGNGQF